MAALCGRPSTVPRPRSPGSSQATHMQASSFTACAFATEVHRVGPSGPQNLNLSLHHQIPPHRRREGTESMSNRRHQGFNIHHSKKLVSRRIQTSIIHSPLRRPGLAAVETGWANPECLDCRRAQPLHATPLSQPIYPACHLPCCRLCSSGMLIYHNHRATESTAASPNCRDF